ncbi:MAG: histidine phosphatase family protein [Pseudomonadota bacterium]
MTPAPRILMIRHTRVCDSLKGLCYGATDVALSKDADTEMDAVCQALTSKLPADIELTVVHSGLSRAARLAEKISNTFKTREPAVDPRIQEMNFGEWELKSWQGIFLSVGHRMSDMIHKPETYAPPGGETAHAVRDRVLAWYNDATAKTPPGVLTIAVSHGGPIAALRGTLAEQSAMEWPKLIPAYGEIIDPTP